MLRPPARASRSSPVTCCDALAERLPRDALLVEECPSSQPELYQRIPVRVPFGFFSTANGCLGFGLAGSIGLRMGLPDRPVVAVLGDGSTTYAIQALWSAAHYDVGVLLIVLANGRYAVMDGLARGHGGAARGPDSERLTSAGMARVVRLPLGPRGDYDDLIRVLDEVLPESCRPGRAAAGRSGGGGGGVAVTGSTKTKPADITAAAVASFERCSDPRLRELMRAWSGTCTASRPRCR